MGFSLTNAAVSILNNTISNNDALCIGGIGFDLFGGTGTISSNLIYNNTNNKSEWGAGGLAFDEASGTITISNNSIFNNINQATGSGGLGINSPLAGASFLIENNWIYTNSGHKIGGIGVTSAQAPNPDISISGNTIFNNRESGIGIFGSSFINIQNNLIDNNGLDDIMMFGEHYAAGIQFRDSTFTNNNVSLNTITNNLFAGIQVFDSTGYIGPDNVIKYNGNGQSESCRLRGPGSGDGGVAVRDLDTDTQDTLIVSDNVITDVPYFGVSLSMG